ncbi:MAG: MFS transporter [Actinomycetes bacterium]
MRDPVGAADDLRDRVGEREPGKRQGVAGIGRVEAPWQTYAAFIVMGVGWACLSMTAVATALAPWFEKYQGRAVSIASLGASVGGMAGVPILLFGIAQAGFAATTTIAAVVAFAVLLPLAWFVMKHRPQDIGLLPDGADARASVVASAPARRWNRSDALRTAALRSVMVGFGIGMLGMDTFGMGTLGRFIEGMDIDGIGMAGIGTYDMPTLGRRRSRSCRRGLPGSSSWITFQASPFSAAGAAATATPRTSVWSCSRGGRTTHPTSTAGSPPSGHHCRGISALTPLR